MASFEDHIQQAIKNINFLQNINNQISDCYDWQITCGFYSSLHLVNAHLSKFKLHYRTHTDVKHALNPEVSMSISKIPEDVFVAYISLQSLSRRARYLVNDKEVALQETQAALVYEKHFEKAIRHLNTIIDFIVKKYDCKAFPVIKIKTSSTNLNDLSWIKKKTD